MKKLLFTCSLLAVAAILFAQNAYVNNPNASPKELMKMQEVKMMPVQRSSFHMTFVITDGLSKKEQMKAETVKITMTGTTIEPANSPDLCPSCLALCRLSAKEKMKAESAGIFKCPMINDTEAVQPGKCRYCGMSLALR
jgi:hypothetical protein